MKRTWYGFLVVTLLLECSLALAKEPRPLSANGKPLIFQVSQISVTREPNQFQSEQQD